jgi:DNA-binding transcriptional MerR regulator
MQHDIKIGEFAERCGVSRDTVRFYERVGLLPKPSRSESRHRIYDRKAVARLQFIRGAQRLGLTLEDIRRLLLVHETRGPDAGKRIVELLRSRADAIDSEISKLLALRRLLDKSIKLCGGSPFGSFSVLERLALDPGSRG